MRFAGDRPGGRQSQLAPLAALEFGENLPDLGAKAGGDVVARQRVGHVGGEKTDLRAAVEAAARELEAVKRLGARQCDHRVGELNLAAGTAVLRRQQVENLRLQNVAAGEDEVR